jgi:hypothetical protein
MAGERPPYGPLLCAAGAILLAVAVFLPWYGVSFTPQGLAYIQQVGNQVAAEYGNATLQSYVSGLHTSLSGLAGQQVVAVSAHQAFKYLNVVLLIVAGVGCVLALLALAARQSSGAQANRGPLALLGAVAAACVLYRVIVRPAPAGELVTLSLREGAWLALLGSLAMVAGALWPRGGERAGSSSAGTAQSAFSELSGWTPEA